MATLERFDADFRMDTAFYQRTGIVCSNLQLVPIFAIKSGAKDWLKSIKPVLAARYLHDYESGMDDRYFNLGVMLDFVKAELARCG